MSSEIVNEEKKVPPRRSVNVFRESSSKT